MQPEWQEGTKEITRHPAEAQLTQLLSCHICYDKVRCATMCPYCSKLYCQGCIRRSLQNKMECPNCRKSLKTIPITHCSRFISELQSVLEELVEHKILDDKCIEHNVVQNYYCRQCTLPICCQCEMFGQHKGHQVEQLKKVYDSKCNKVRQQLMVVRQHIKVKENQIKELQQHCVDLNKEKDRRLAEIQENTQFYRLKILNEACSEEKFLKEYAAMINDEIVKIEQLEKTIKKRLSNPHKLGQPLATQEEMIKELCQKEFISPNTDQKLNFISQLIPQYLIGDYTIENFSKKMKEKGAVVYSQPLEHEGLKWRLKVYPSGNETAEGTHLSVFLQLVSSFRIDNLYEYQIELVNQKNPQSRMLREYSSNFEPGECWGYNKYIRLENILSEGFHNPTTDTIKIRYYVRQPSYYQVSVHKSIYAEHLDKEIARQEEEIKTLQQMLTKNIQ